MFAKGEKDTILAGDCGGTNTRLLLFEVGAHDELEYGERAPGRLVHSAQYKNEDFSSFEEVLQTFCAAAGLGERRPVSACLAVAGPVSRNTVTFTNREWSINGNHLEDSEGIEKVMLINDFVANGYGLLTLDESEGSVEVVALNDAHKVANGVIACIGAGTGLGECFLTPLSSGYETWPSEGGHAEFAPRNALEVELLEFLKDKFQEKHRVSVERVVSGRGLANVYEFLAQRFPDRVDARAHREVRAAGDEMGGVIAKHAAASPGGLCDQALDILIGAYGAEAGVAALKWLPVGGLYVTGGLTPKNIERIKGQDSLFMRAFRDKGRVSPLLQHVPLKAVLVEDLGQRGAHWAAFKLYRTICEDREDAMFSAMAPRSSNPSIEVERLQRRSSTSATQWGMMVGHTAAPHRHDGEKLRHMAVGAAVAAVAFGVASVVSRSRL